MTSKEQILSTSALIEWRDKILPLRQQWNEKDRLLEERLDTLLPMLMQREGIDCWIVVGSEYNEDPVFDTLTPASVLNASRCMVLLFHLQQDGTVERLVIARRGLGDLYQSVESHPEESTEDTLRRVVSGRNPQTIGINVSFTFPLADGLSHTTHAWLLDTLGQDLAARTRSAEGLAVGWLETRSSSEMVIYPSVVDLSRTFIRTAFSPRVITPGITTTDDVVWWMRQQVHDFGLKPAFSFTVTLDAQDQAFDILGRTNPRNRILPGDVLRCDFGITYLGLTTDQQESIYILKPGETDAPEGLQAAMRTANRAQDILFSQAHLGRTGNDVLHAAREQAAAEGIDACFFCHPIGTHVHGAGTLIGRWDCQDGLPGLGDYKLRNDTCYAIEFYIKQPISEWGGREFTMLLEQDAAFVSGTFRWLSGRQTQFLTM